MDNPWIWIYIGSVLAFIFILYMLLRKIKMYKHSHNKTFDAIKSNISKDDAFEQLFSKREKEITGCSDLELVEPEFAENWRYTDLVVLKQKTELAYDTTFNSRIYRVKKFPITLLDGSTGVGMYAQDVTNERIASKKQEKVLLRNKILVDLLSQNFHDKQQQLNFLLNEVIKLTDSKDGCIKTFGDNSIELYHGLQSPSISHFKAYICNLIAENKEPLIINDFYNSIYKSLIPDNNFELANFMAVPLIIDKNIVAIIGLGNKPSDYDELDVIGITLLMGEAWNAIVRKESEEKLIFERDKYLQTLVSIDDGVIVTDQNGIIEMLNKAAEKLTGWPVHEAVGRHYSEVYTIMREKSSSSEIDLIQNVLRNGEAVSTHNNSVLLSRDGKKYDIEESAAPIRNDLGWLGAVLIFRDITDIKQQRSKIEHLSFHDPLTGLYNRRFFEEELKRLDVKRNLPLSIIMGDANGLKLANDIFGHTYGDMLIKKAARVLKRVCREDDIIARLDGDEFIILLPKTTPEDASNIISRIKEEFSKEQVKLIKGNLSMGMDTKFDVSENIYDIYKNAEENMYTAKAIESEQFSASTLELIMNTLFENNPAEKRHALIVSNLSAEIGKKLNLRNTEIKKLQDAGYYHDIGKITLDPKLLKKHVNLTDREWNEIKKHPITGYRILTRYNSTVDLAEIVLAHQERYDGLGYPKGLKGEEIPLASRIIAIAESYERRLSGDDVSAPYSVEEAQQYIKDNAGTRFAPSLIDAFLSASSRFAYTL
jgi:diguanylate cyclase (GGDEF)-like protein/PAS domain S-box-containing protein